MSGIINILSTRPLIVGNVVKVVIGLAAMLGVVATDAETEAIVAVVVAVLALIAAITAREQAKVTPVVSAAKLVDQSVDVVNGLLRDITSGTGDTTRGSKDVRHAEEPPL